jgi:nucleotide-binding universal stress UspA family protein
MKSKRKSPFLVAVDGSEYSDKAFQYACNLSINNQIPLLIANVVEEYATIGKSILRELKGSSKKLLDEYKTEAESLGVEAVSTFQCVGNPAEEILKIASKKSIDTLVIGSRGKYGTSKDTLGGTSYKLIHYCQCTVTVVK